MSENLSIPQPFSTVDPLVTERLLKQYPNQTVEAVHFPSFFDKVPKNNDAVLLALGSFKDQAIGYAEDTYKRGVKQVNYVADLRDVEDGKQQRNTSWHTEEVVGGIAILTSSVLPTLFIAKAHDDVNVEPYFNRMEIPHVGSCLYSAAGIMRGKEDGVLSEHQPAPFDMIELDGRIHAGALNTT